MYRSRYANVFHGGDEGQAVQVSGGLTDDWDSAATYVQNPPYFVGMSKEPDAVEDIKGARVLALLGDSITTDHISPAGSIKKDGPAGDYLIERQIRPLDFNSYGARRGNHEIMMRGTFANIRLQNEMVPGVTGGMTRHVPTGKPMSIYEAAMTYQEAGTPLAVIGGKESGTGSTRDWAAKGPRPQAAKAVIAQDSARNPRPNQTGRSGR